MEIKDYIDKWRFAKEAYDGLDATSLVQFNREHDEKFKARQDLCYYVNYIKPKAKQFVSYLTQKNVTRTIDNPLLKPILQDVDRKGNSIDIFMQNFAINAKVRGANLCLIDMPKNRAINLKEQIEKRIIPYFVEIVPESIVQYKQDEFGKFEWIILEDSIDITKPFGKQEVETIYRYYDSSSWIVYESDKKTIIEEGEHNIGVCPVIAFSDSGLFPSAGDFVQIADISKRIMNLRSELDEILRSQTFSILTYKATRLDELSELNIGTDNLLIYPEERPSFISAPDAPARVYQEEIERLEALIEKIANTQVNQSTNNESGIAKEYRFQALNASLINFATQLEDFERRCIDIACRWLDIQNNTSINYPKDYNIKDIKNEIEIASAMFELNIGDTYTALKKEQLALLDLNSLEEDQKEKIVSEIEDNLHDRNQPA